MSNKQQIKRLWDAIRKDRRAINNYLKSQGTSLGEQDDLVDLEEDEHKCGNALGAEALISFAITNDNWLYIQVKEKNGEIRSTKLPFVNLSDVLSEHPRRMLDFPFPPRDNREDINRTPIQEQVDILCYMLKILTGGGDGAPYVSIPFNDLIEQAVKLQKREESLLTGEYID